MFFGEEIWWTSTQQLDGYVIFALSSLSLFVLQLWHLFIYSAHQTLQTRLCISFHSLSRHFFVVRGLQRAAQRYLTLLVTLRMLRWPCHIPFLVSESTVIRRMLSVDRRHESFAPHRIYVTAGNPKRILVRMFLQLRADRCQHGHNIMVYSLPTFVVLFDTCPMYINR